MNGEQPTIYARGGRPTSISYQRRGSSSHATAATAVVVPMSTDSGCVDHPFHSSSSVLTMKLPLSSPRNTNNDDDDDNDDNEKSHVDREVVRYGGSDGVAEKTAHRWSTASKRNAFNNAASDGRADVVVDLPPAKLLVQSPLEMIGIPVTKLVKSISAFLIGEYGVGATTNQQKALVDKSETVESLVQVGWREGWRV